MSPWDLVALAGGWLLFAVVLIFAVIIVALMLWAAWSILKAIFKPDDVGGTRDRRG